MFVVDLSFGWPSLTGADLVGIGAAGVIGYAGCADVRKNVSRERVADWLAAGLTVGLVIENVATDARGGYATGLAHGRAIVKAAAELGYDAQDCVLFGGFDADSHAGDWPQLLAYEQGFASVVPVPGYYGDSDSIDYLHDHGSVRWWFWQSDSRDFSPRNPTPNAHLIQRYNDPRAHGLAVDVDDVQHAVPMMGADMQLDPNDPVVKAIRGDIAAVTHQVNGWAALIVHGDANHPNSQDAEAAHLAAVQDAVAKLAIGPVDVDALSAAIIDRLRVNITAAPAAPPAAP